jgi:hypothetical protein
MDHRSQPGDGKHGAYSSVRLIRGSQEEAEHFAALRRQLGDEAVGELLRARELMEHPRQLTQDERSIVDVTIAPVLRDLRAADAILPEVRYQAWEDRGTDYVRAFIGPVGQTTGQGVWVALASPAPERVAQLAEQVQEWEVEELCAAGRPATWPECPEHPGSHPLEPTVGDDGAASWRCPRSGMIICAIGELGGAGLGRARRQRPDP